MVGKIDCSTGIPHLFKAEKNQDWNDWKIKEATYRARSAVGWQLTGVGSL